MAIGDTIVIDNGQIIAAKGKDGIASFSAAFNFGTFASSKLGELIKLNQKGVFCKITIEPLPTHSLKPGENEAGQIAIPGTENADETDNF
jgi:hypothetical protein